MLRLGAHESVAGGLHRSLERGASVGCESLQIWTKNSRQWKSPPLVPEEVARFRQACAESHIRPIVAHASYLINIASPKDTIYDRSIRALIDEGERCGMLGLPYLVLHPGSHTGAGLDLGLARAQAALSTTLQALAEHRVTILLETTAGAGAALGSTLADLSQLLKVDEGNGQLGVCLDTCHLFAAGYDLRDADAYQALMTAIDYQIGLDLVRVVHLNDSKHPLGSHKDRHEHIGKGELGLEGFRHILADPRLQDIAGILETAKSDDLHEDRVNLAALRAIAAGTPRETIPLVGDGNNEGAEQQ